MKITEGGFIFKPTGEFPWSRSHAQVPFALKLRDGVIRVFFSTRDEQSRSCVSFVDIDEKNPTNVLYIHNQPCLQYGKQGNFDDSGTMPSWFIKNGNTIRLYYTAWNKSDSAAYRLSIGLAESNDEGKTFNRLFTGPVLDRGINDPVWVGQPCVLHDNGTWKMWYLSCQKIDVLENRPEPFYNVRYAESNDGITWERKEITCIDFDTTTDAIGRPCVWKHNGEYVMLHSNRKALGYRTLPEAGYRIVLSRSIDGITWKQDTNFNLQKASSGWNSIMNEYTCIYPVAPNKYYVFYNGLGFGQSGFGYFTLEL